MSIDFNPRSREGSDSDNIILFDILRISIHAPARGATSSLISPFSFALFQSTLPRGERLVLLFITHNLMSISIHAPARGATPFIFCKFQPPVFQSTLPRGERLRTSVFCFLLCMISIHAPARGATRHRVSPGQFLRISIHAPARGATQVLCISYQTGYNFNPRSREGSDTVSYIIAI